MKNGPGGKLHSVENRKVRYPNDVSLEAISTPPLTPPLTPADTHPARVLAWLSKRLSRGLSAADLSLPQYRLLTWIARGSSAPKALAGALAVTRPTLTALVDGLVARQLVERVPDPDDRRRVGHRITEAGRAALEQADELGLEVLSDLASQLPARDAARAMASLELWGRALEAAHIDRTEERTEETGNAR